MAEKNNATCKICGKAYYMCMSCADSMRAHPWKAYTDTANCYRVYQVVRGLSTGVYTKDEAKEKLKNVDLKDVDSFRPNIKKIVKDVLKEENAVVETVEKTEEAVVEDIVKVEKPEIVERPKNNMKPTVSRKKFNRM